MTTGIPPQEFDAQLYKNLWTDLADMSEAELAVHYQEFGREEGRRCHQIVDRSQFASIADGMVLEIGPFASPVIKGPQARYADILPTEQLKKNAVELGLDDSSVPNIDWVVEPTDLSPIDQTFDSVFSSHAIEHQPNLVKHLQQVESLLNEGGRYFLAIPDHRYCFDHFKPTSTIDEVIGTYLEAPRAHSARSVIQRLRLNTHNDSVRHWEGDHGSIGDNPYYPDLKGLELIRQAVNEFDAMGSTPLNEHSWFFTPEEFRKIISTCFELGLIQLTVERLYPTMRGSIEFWAILCKQPAKMHV